MRIKMLVDRKDRESPGVWFKMGEIYDITDERAQDAIDAGYAVEAEEYSTYKPRKSKSYDMGDLYGTDAE